MKPPHSLPIPSATATATTSIALAIIAASIALAMLQLAAFRPGIMVWDAIRQYGQALSGRYDDWHPPAMNWLWRQLGMFGAGPGPMLVVQVALYWTGFAVLAGAAARRGRRAAAAAVLACALLPVPVWLIGTILKDSLMAGALLVAAGLLAILRPDDRLLRGVAIALLIATATLRFNAAAACLPLLVAALPGAWTRTTTRLAAASLIALVPLLAAMPLANRALHAERSGVELSLVIYDLGGITRFSGSDAFPPLAIANPIAVNARCWSPVSWDSYAWWVADPCPIGFDMLRSAFAAQRIDPTRWWLGQIVRHPIAYAEHRLAHADRNLRLWVHDDDLPGLSLATDPNPWGYATPPNRLREALATIATASLATPFGWPACWLALGIGLLIAAPWRGGGDMAQPLLWSAVLYALSYGPLSVASEVRYHSWTMVAVALGGVTLLARPHRFAGIATGRRILAATIPLATILVSVVARMT